MIGLKRFIANINISSLLTIILCAFIISLTSVFYPNDVAISISKVIKILVFTVIYSVLLSLFFFGSYNLICRDRYFVSNNVLSFWKMFLLLFFVYCLVLVVFYPGVCGWDTEYQLVDLFDGTQIMHRDSWGDYYVAYTLSDHMNLFDTFLFGAFIKLGMNINNVSLGVFIYCVLQAALFSFSCTLMTLKIREWGAGKLCCYSSLLFFLLSPFIWLYSINMIKDSINAALFMLYFICFICILKGEIKYLWKFIVLSLLVSLTKKTGMIIVVPSNILLSVYLFKKSTVKTRALMLFSAFAPVILISFVLNKILYPAFSVYQDEALETFGFSLQQISRLYKYHPEVFSKNDLEIIDAVVPIETLSKNYNYNLTDGIKDTYRPLASSGQLLDFFLLWLRNAFTYPHVFIKSLIGTNGGFFSAKCDINVYTEFNDWGNLGVHTPSSFNSLKVWFSETYNDLCNVPVLNVLFTLSFYSWVLPCFMLFKAFKEKSYKIAISSIPVIMSIITFILSPTVNSRYALHIIMIAPLLFCLSNKCFELCEVSE